VQFLEVRIPQNPKTPYFEKNIKNKYKSF